MLSKFTWGEFLIAAGLVLFAYYVVVILLYYRQELREFISGKFKAKVGKEHEESPVQTSTDESSFEELEMVVNDLRYAILEKAGHNAVKSDVLQALKQRLSMYEGLKKPAYRVAINNYIIEHAKEICGVVFSEEELEAEWGILPR